MDFKPLLDALEKDCVPMLKKDGEAAAKAAINAVVDFAEMQIPISLAVFAKPALELIRGLGLKEADKIDGIEKD